MMSESKATPSATSDTTPTPEQIARAQKFEREQLTRRQAIRKLGFGAGAAAFFALSTDDLAHMVGKEMQKRAGDSKIANMVASELSNAGAAFANTTICQHCCNQLAADESGCNCIFDVTAFIACVDVAQNSYKACYLKNCRTAPCQNVRPADCIAPF